MPIVEVCAYSLQSCLNAQNAGAKRIELCDNRYEGGTTPSPGLIELARKHLHIDLAVMIRPRGGDFCYSEPEFEVMKQDILWGKKLKVDGVVFGILQKTGKIDRERTAQLVEVAKPLPCTFHRAFDFSPDAFEAMDDLIQCGIKRILTSGQKNTALEGISLIKGLVETAAGRIGIMAGSGINESNAFLIAQSGVDALHLSAKNTYPSRMTYRKEGIFLSGLAQIPEYEILEADEQIIRKVLALVSGK